MKIINYKCYKISESGGKIKGLYPKYYVSNGDFKKSFYSCSIKEAKEKINARLKGVSNESI